MNEKTFIAEKFEGIYQRNYKRVYTYLFRQLKNKETAEDFTQEVFMTLYTKCTDISDEAMVCSFLFRCARWKVLDQYRKQQGARPVEAGLEIPEAVIDENALELLENPVLEGEVLDIVYSVFSKYTDRDVNIFLQYKVDEISVNQIAADSGVTPYKVRKITRNISYTLKENLARYAMSD